ncbi:MAG: type I-E CRISPR-associated protein Cse2/CasB [Gordonia sp. (in: high G+C Gram-positive bacteria)]
MTTSEKQSYKSTVYNHVARRASELYAGARANRGPAVAALAKLRRAANTEVGDDAAAWQIAFLGFSASDYDSEYPSSAETGVYRALTLFALHQQSKSEPMHVDGPSLGAAIGRLARVGEADSPSEPVVRRFNALVTATSTEEFRWHLRSLVGQLRADSIPLDYGRLADDLSVLAGRTRDGESKDEARRRVQLRWSRDFSRPQKQTADGPESTSSDATDSSAKQSTSESTEN